MANKLIVDENLLDIEYNMLKEELTSLDELFKESKNRLDSVAKIPSKANPVFMASQTANLISIKEKRLNIIKELTNIKKTKMDMQIKTFSANNKIDEQTTGVSKEILDIFRLLKDNKNDIINNIEESNEEETLTDKEIDNLLNEKLNLLNDKTIKEIKQNQNPLPVEYSIVCTKDKKLFIIDEDCNIIEDCEFDTSVINIVKFDIVDDIEYGYDEDNNIYEVVEV